MRKRFAILATATLALISIIAFALAGCSNFKEDNTWKERDFYDASLPDFSKITAENGLGIANVTDDGWYLVMQDDFKGTKLNEGTIIAPELQTDEIWTTSPHGIRWDKEGDKKVKEEDRWNYWCSDMLSLDGEHAVIKSEFKSGVTCPECLAAYEKSSGKKADSISGRFTTGIETRRLVKNEGIDSTKGDSDDLLFAQAFGYFEARVQFPKATGLWSAFWLQSSNQRKIYNEGLDGTEIDVYESAFIKNPTRMGHALLWNGYGKYAKVEGNILDTKKDLYDGFHTFGLKWTPEYYVFYIDGVPTWASMGGGVAKVKEFLRLTVEIDVGDGWGPHGQKIGQFKSAPDFLIDYVKVYQNENFTPFEMKDSYFKGELDKAN